MDGNVHHGAPGSKASLCPSGCERVAGAWLPPVWWASSGSGFPRPAPTPPQGVTKAPQLPLQAEETQLSLCTKAPSQKPSLARASWGRPGRGGWLLRLQQSWQKSPPSQQHRGAEKAPAGNASWGCTSPGGLVSGLKCKQQQEQGWWGGLLHKGAHHHPHKVMTRHEAVLQPDDMLGNPRLERRGAPHHVPAQPP